MSLARMRRSGILGINRRNVTYTLGHNRRALYPLVDDKLSTKRLCQAAGIPVPKLLAVVRTHHETQRLGETVRNFPAFVVKPARGAMGNGILVLEQREGGLFRGSRAFDLADLIYHSAGIVSGLYSLAGSADVAVIEERLKTDPGFDRLVANGVPDVRIIVFEGVPVMAMCRLPTIESNGRANLHQGGVGAGLDLMTGTLTTSIQRDRPVKRSPDTLAVIEGFRIPHFEQALNTAVKATDQTGLGYVGADVVIDANMGPVILELNARPGLAIQLANREGLRPRLDKIEAWLADQDEPPDFESRVAFGRSLAAKPE